MFEHLMDYVNYEGKTYYVSTNDTFDMGLETMIFKCVTNSKTIESWSDLYCERYSSYDVAESRHKEIVENIGEYIK